MAETLTDKALRARENAYAPYSGFLVGAALACTDGSVYTGCNVENIAYGSTICAERIAIGQAIAAGNRAFRVLAVVGGTTAKEAMEKPCYPCGACLQVLAEFCPPDFPVLLQDGVHPLRELLPNQFHFDDASGNIKD